MVNRHDLRHARYRGRAKVLVQALLTGFVVNLKRMVRLLFAPPKAAVPPEAAPGSLRAEVVLPGSASANSRGSAIVGGTVRAELVLQT